MTIIILAVKNGEQCVRHVSKTARRLSSTEHSYIGPARDSPQHSRHTHTYDMNGYGATADGRNCLFISSWR